MNSKGGKKVRAVGYCKLQECNILPVCGRPVINLENWVKVDKRTKRLPGTIL